MAFARLVLVTVTTDNSLDNTPKGLPDDDRPYAVFNWFFGAFMARVLIIDDSPTETYKLTSMLEKNGHVVLTADNGEAGIALAQKELPDVVLMDVVMPGLNGFQATRQLSKMPETAHIPVIIVTTKDQQTDRVWGMRQGAKAYLAKPITQEVLMSAMAEVMR